MKIIMLLSIVSFLVEVDSTLQLIGNIVNSVGSVKNRKISAIQRAIAGGRGTRKPMYKNRKKPSYKPPNSNRPHYKPQNSNNPQSKPNKNANYKNKRPSKDMIGRDPHAESYGNALFKPGNTKSTQKPKSQSYDSDQILSLVQEMHALVQQMAKNQNTHANTVGTTVNQNAYAPNINSGQSQTNQFNPLQTPSKFPAGQASNSFGNQNSKSQTSGFNPIQASNSYSVAQASPSFTFPQQNNQQQGSYNQNNNQNQYIQGNSQTNIRGFDTKNQFSSGGQKNTRGQFSQNEYSLSINTKQNKPINDGGVNLNQGGSNYNTNLRASNSQKKFRPSSVSNNNIIQTEVASTQSDSYGTPKGNLISTPSNTASDINSDSYGTPKAAPLNDYMSKTNNVENIIDDKNDNNNNYSSKNDATQIKSTFEQMIEALSDYRDQQMVLKERILDDVRKRRKTSLNDVDTTRKKHIKFPVHEQMALLLELFDNKKISERRADIGEILEILTSKEFEALIEEATSSLHVDKFVY